MRNKAGWMRYVAVIPTVVLTAILVLLAHPEQDLDAQQTAAYVVAENDGQATLRREADHATQYLAAQHDIALTAFKQRLIEQVGTAYSFIDALQTHAQGLLSSQQIKMLAKESLRPVRFFNGRGYYFMGSTAGHVVLSPISPETEGRTWLADRDDQGTYTARGLMRAARQQGGGFFSYRWFIPGQDDRMDEKVSFVRLYPKFGWVIGAGDYLSTIENGILSEAELRLGATRFGRSGAIGLSTHKGEVALFPEVGSERETAPISNQSVPAQILWGRITAKAHQGGGPISFQWPDPDTGRMTRRLAWVQNASATERVIYASANIDDFLPPMPVVQRQSFLTQGRALLIGVLAIVATLLCLWLIPVRHAS